MKNTSRKVLVAAAMAGLLSGAAIWQGCADGTNAPPGSTNAAPGKAAPIKKAPQVHDCAGENDCKGLGGCKTDDHTCKFTNACKGKGGCALTKKDIEKWEQMQKDAARHPSA